MLSPNQVVTIRKAIEMTYDCTCDVIEKEKYKKENKSIAFRENKVLENEKCKLSFETITNNKQNDVKANMVQIIKLFLRPEIIIKSGSKINVTNVRGEIVSYRNSGKPAIYETHQEIVLELWESWA